VGKDGKELVWCRGLFFPLTYVRGSLRPRRQEAERLIWDGRLDAGIVNGKVARGLVRPAPLVYFLEWAARLRYQKANPAKAEPKSTSEAGSGVANCSGLLSES